MWKISAGLLVVLVFATAIIVHQERTIDRLANERRQAIAFAQRDSAAATNYKNQLGHQVQRTELTELSLRNAQDLINTDRLSFIRQLEGVKQNLKNLEAAVKVQASATADLRLNLGDTTIIINGDTTMVRKFGYVDEYNQVHGFLEGDTTALISARISVPIDGAMFWERSRFLGLRIGRKKWFGEFTTPNPWVKIDNSEFIKIQKR